MTVVVPHITHGGGGGVNDGMMDGSLIFRREPAGLSATDAWADPQSVMSGTMRVIRANSEWFNYRPVG